MLPTAIKKAFVAPAAKVPTVLYLSEEYQHIKRHPIRTALDSYNASFAECLRTVLPIVQLTGFLPVHHLPNDRVRFSFRSVRFLYSCAMALVILALSVLSLMKALHDNMEYDKIITFVFYVVDFLVIVQFQLLAFQWPNIMVVWRDFERTLAPNEHLLGRRYSLKIIFQLFVVFGVTCTSISELLSVVAGIEKGALCVHVDGAVEKYFRQAFPQIFLYTAYAHWKGALIQAVQFVCTFVRMLLDCFLMFISLGLGRLIGRLNLQYRLPQNSRAVSADFWARYKEQYLQFMNLVAYVDSRIGHIVILCFLSDLYLICVRILNTIKWMTTVRQAMFFWFVLLFLIIRLIFVCIIGARIYEEAKRPLLTLRKLPVTEWSLEAQRFQDLITTNDVCLSGYGFFKLKRTLLLSICGTIVTYELVLMQFNDSGSLDSTDKNPCN